MMSELTRKLMIAVSTLLVFMLIALVAILFVLLSASDRAVLLGNTKTFNHGETERKYRVYIPGEITDDTKLIVGLHGFSDTSRRFAYYTGLHNADPNAVVVYPEAIKPTESGIETGWNASFCCGSGWISKADDVGFITELTESIRDEYKVNPKNVFVTGFSNGGFMSHRLVAEQPEVFKAASIVAGTIGTTKVSLEPKTPVPILLIHGKKDATIPYGGGSGNDPNFNWLDFETTKTVWQKNNGDQAPVETIVHEEGTHEWNDWRILNIWHRVAEASGRTVEFFDGL